MSTHRRIALVVAATIAPLVAACGSDDAATTERTTTTVGPSYEVVPAAVVTAGLAEVRATAAQIRSTIERDQAGAKALSTTMYDTWFEFEGTVRKNDKDLYLQMEDGLAAIKAGVQQNDVAKVDKGLADLDAGATAYLAAHP